MDGYYNIRTRRFLSASKSVGTQHQRFLDFARFLLTLSRCFFHRCRMANIQTHADRGHRMQKMILGNKVDIEERTVSHQCRSNTIDLLIN